MAAKRSRLRRWILGGLAVWNSLFLTYFLVSYVILPLFWREYEERPSSTPNSRPKVTHNAEGIPGDPLNVGLVGERDQVVHAMVSVGWKRADPINFESSLKIAESVLLKFPYQSAPISTAYLFGRMQDLAFEKEVGASAAQRHHVRWWRSDELSADGRHLWYGSATFDEGVELSALTGQITHRVNPDVDRHRDHLMADLRVAGQLEGLYQIMGVGPTQNGQNSSGDRYYTDGMISVGILAATKAPLIRRIFTRRPQQ